MVCLCTCLIETAGAGKAFRKFLISTRVQGFGDKIVLLEERSLCDHEESIKNRNFILHFSGSKSHVHTAPKHVASYPPRRFIVSNVLYSERLKHYTHTLQNLQHFVIAFHDSSLAVLCDKLFPGLCNPSEFTHFYCSPQLCGNPPVIFSIQRLI